MSSAYKLVNKIVETENLVRDYNIYIFHGTDGDDWDTTGKETIPELEKMLHPKRPGGQPEPAQREPASAQAPNPNPGLTPK